MCLQWLNFGPSFYIFSFDIVLTLFVLHENQSDSVFSIKGKVKINQYKHNHSRAGA